MVDPLSGGGAGGLYGISNPGSRQILQRSTKDLILPRLVTREKLTLVPTGNWVDGARVRPAPSKAIQSDHAQPEWPSAPPPRLEPQKSLRQRVCGGSPYCGGEVLPSAEKRGFRGGTPRERAMDNRCCRRRRCDSCQAGCMACRPSGPPPPGRCSRTRTES